jgi:hypothetical protein
MCFIRCVTCSVMQFYIQNIQPHVADKSACDAELLASEEKMRYQRYTYL